MNKLFLYFLFTSAFYKLNAQVSPDARIYLHYDSTEVSYLIQNAPAKLKSLNFYYTSSYTIVQNPTCTSCATVDPNTFDVFPYENKRKENERVIIFVSRDGKKIELLSINELKEIYKTFTK